MNMNDPGLKIPMAFDSASQKPSVTLLFMWVANAVAILSLIYLHIKADAVTATMASCGYGITNTVLYMIRKLNKANVDIKSGKIELDGADDAK